MTNDQLQQYLIRLGLTASDAAQLLSVEPRTVRRWLSGEPITGPAETTIRAWIRLHDRHLAWRPDSESILTDDQDQIERYRWHATQLAALIERVEARQGPRLNAWEIDFDRPSAVLGPYTVSFYRLPNGGFSLSTYRRADGDPDVERDHEILEDAAYCIAHALKTMSLDFGPVVLVGFDGPAKGRVATPTIQECRSNREAIKRACEGMRSGKLHGPFIKATNSSEVLWEPLQLRRACERRIHVPPALKALAAYVRANSHSFVRSGARMLTQAESDQRRERIESLAEELDALAIQTRDGLVEYPEFDKMLGALHAAGFFPQTELVSNVAQAMVG